MQTDLRILLLGATGRLGSSLHHCWKSSLNIIAPTHSELDIQNASATQSVITEVKPHWIINCTSISSLETCEEQPELAYHINAEVPKTLATQASNHHSRLIHFSTDYVFDGKNSAPYKETDVPNPLSVYGQTKHLGEQAVLEYPPHFVFRVSWLFGSQKPSFPDQLIEALIHKNDFYIATDKYSVPTYTHDIARWLHPIVSNNLSLPGDLYHLCNSGSCSWETYALYVIRNRLSKVALEVTDSNAVLSDFNLNKLSNKLEIPSHLHFCPLTAVPNLRVSRPLYSTMDNNKFATASNQTLRPWYEALKEHIEYRGRNAEPRKSKP